MTPKTSAAALACLASLCLASGAARAQMPGQNPDWTCEQRLVPTLTPATYWADPLTNVPDWHGDPRVSALVEAVGPSDVETKDGLVQIDAFAKPLSHAERQKLLPMAFIGLVDQTNEARGDVIDKIETLTRRQRSLAELVSQVSQDLRKIPDNATGAAAQRRDEITQRRDFLIRSFSSIEATMRYACAVPGDLEGRLGAYARELQQQL